MTWRCSAAQFDSITILCSTKPLFGKHFYWIFSLLNLFNSFNVIKVSSAAKILLIEDDPGIVMTLRRVLAEEGHEILVERRGDTGLERARGGTFDVVITDMKLPGPSGMEIVRELHTTHPRLPIILMTAYGT